MKHINALLFDFDGTLLDSKKAMVNVYYKLCLKYGTIAFPLKEIENQFGSSFRSIYESLDKTKKHEIEQAYLKLMIEEEKKLAKLFPGVRDSLVFLKVKGYKTALVTNKERPIVLSNLANFKLCHLFDTVVTISDVTNPKPNPEPLEKAMKAIGAEKHKTIMLGDSIFDVGACKRAGIQSAVIDWYNKYPINGLEPDFLFHNISEFMLRITEHRKVV